MLKTIILLIAAVVAVPVVAVLYDEPLTDQQTQILRVLGWICGGIAFACFALGEITGNCSQVDKLWSVIPIVYVWVVAVKSGMGDRAVLMASLVSLWGARLTYNFSRRGAYSWKFWAGEEDYRWGILRQMPLLKGRFRWMLFNLFFICSYQNFLILLFTLPTVVAIQTGDHSLHAADFVLAVLFVGFLVFETVADQQQWNFQNEKHRLKTAGEGLQGEYADGFISSGLWKFIRHPNYMAEQAIWIVFYFFSVAATGRWFNWSAAGAILLMLLFQGSSDFSEGISAGKYPAYKDYQARAGRFLPKLIRKEEVAPAPSQPESAG